MKLEWTIEGVKVSWIGMVGVLILSFAILNKMMIPLGYSPLFSKLSFMDVMGFLLGLSLIIFDRIWLNTSLPDRMIGIHKSTKKRKVNAK